MITYILAVKCIDGVQALSFTDEADLMNFIMDAEGNVLGMALSYIEEK